MRLGRKFLFFAPIALVGVLLFVALGGFIVQQLWNWLLPSIFGWRTITFWQGLGLLALCRILFGGIGRGRGPRFGRRMRDRWDHVTPEERDRFRARMHERWGYSPPAPATPPTSDETSFKS
jgi:hypothetical protein